MIAEEDRAVEAGIETGNHPERFDGALDVLHARIEIGVQHILVIAVRIIDQDVGRSAAENGGDDGIDLFRHELAREVVVTAVGLGHRLRADTADAFHVHGDEDAKRPLGRRRGCKRERQRGENRECAK